MERREVYAEEFRNQLVNRSISDSWETARLEWIPDYPFNEERENLSDAEVSFYKKFHNLNEYNPCYCICGHPIKEHCIIEHVVTKYRLPVGNCCVKTIFPLAYNRNKALFEHVKKCVPDKKKTQQDESSKKAKVSEDIDKETYLVFRKPPQGIRETLPIHLVEVYDELYKAQPKKRKLYQESKGELWFIIPLSLLEGVFEINAHIVNKVHHKLIDKYPSFETALLATDDDDMKVEYVEKYACVKAFETRNEIAIVPLLREALLRRKYSLQELRKMYAVNPCVLGKAIAKNPDTSFEDVVVKILDSNVIMEYIMFQFDCGNMSLEVWEKMTSALSITDLQSLYTSHVQTVSDMYECHFKRFEDMVFGKMVDAIQRKYVHEYASNVTLRRKHWNKASPFLIEYVKQVRDLTTMRCIFDVNKDILKHIGKCMTEQKKIKTFDDFVTNMASVTLIREYKYKHRRIVYKEVFDPNTRKWIKIVDKNGKEGEFQLDLRSITYERGFIRVQWIQLKESGICVDCDKVFHRDIGTKWKTRCFGCYKRNMCPDYRYEQDEPSGTYIDDPYKIYRCHACDKQYKYNIFEYTPCCTFQTCKHCSNGDRDIVHNEDVNSARFLKEQIHDIVFDSSDKKKTHVVNNGIDKKNQTHVVNEITRESGIQDIRDFFEKYKSK